MTSLYFCIYKPNLISSPIKENSIYATENNSYRVQKEHIQKFQHFLPANTRESEDSKSRGNSCESKQAMRRQNSYFNYHDKAIVLLSEHFLLSISRDKFSVLTLNILELKIFLTEISQLLLGKKLFQHTGPQHSPNNEFTSIWSV